MILKKITYMIIIMFTLSSALQGMEHNNISHSSSTTTNLLLENLTPEQNEKIMDLRGEFLQKEIELNRKMRMLRTEHHGCMTRKKIDMEEYQRIEKKSHELKVERILLQREYNKQVLKLIETF